LSYVIQLLGLVDGTPTRFDTQYVVEYDPMKWRYRDVSSIAEVEQLVGEFLTVTDDPTKAKQFASMAEATECWRSLGPGVRPWDGKPNRPLTAFSITVVPIREPSGTL